MWAFSSASATNTSFPIIVRCFCISRLPPPLTTTILASKASPFRSIRYGALTSMDNHNSNNFSSARPRPSGDSGRGKGLETRDDRQRSERRNRGGGGAPKDKIGALGRLLTRILRHMASELNLDMRSDGYVKVQDLLKLNLKTFANIPMRSHSVDDIREAVRKDNKQRFGLLEENGELLIRANQGHSITSVESESLLKPILSSEEAPVCVHGTYKKSLESILQSGLKRMKRLHIHFSSGLPTDGEVISGMRRDVNVLIFLDVRKALEDGMKLYISDNRVILTEGFNGVVPVKYFEKIETWPGSIKLVQHFYTSSFVDEASKEERMSVENGLQYWVWGFPWDSLRKNIKFSIQKDPRLVGQIDWDEVILHLPKVQICIV